MRVTVTVNGEPHHLEVTTRHTLAEVLAPERWACPDRACGACDVVVDGDPVRSCLMLAVQADGAQVRTGG